MPADPFTTRRLAHLSVSGSSLYPSLIDPWATLSATPRGRTHNKTGAIYGGQRTATGSPASSLIGRSPHVHISQSPPMALQNQSRAERAENRAPCAIEMQSPWPQRGKKRVATVGHRRVSTVGSGGLDCLRWSCKGYLWVRLV
jgi:hypothetical protein